MQRTLRCYAEGKGRQWEAVCLDLDVAVQGNSLREVVEDLGSAIELHVNYVLTLPADEQRRFWKRSAPLSMRLRFLWYVLKTTFRSNGANGKERVELLLPCPA